MGGASRQLFPLLDERRKPCSLATTEALSRQLPVDLDPTDVNLRFRSATCASSCSSFEQLENFGLERSDRLLGDAITDGCCILLSLVASSEVGFDFCIFLFGSKISLEAVRSVRAVSSSWARSRYSLTESENSFSMCS